MLEETVRGDIRMPRADTSGFYEFVDRIQSDIQMRRADTSGRVRRADRSGRVRRANTSGRVRRADTHGYSNAYCGYARISECVERISAKIRMRRADR